MEKSQGQGVPVRSLDRFGHGKSLGPRSSETEGIYESFHENKRRLEEKLGSLKTKLAEHARLCKAIRIARVPAVATAILRLMEQRKLLGPGLQVIGTNALYAYEASAGVFFEREITATRDLDVLWDVRSRMRLYASEDMDSAGLVDILKKADRSFDLVRESGFRAVNKTGYMVDLVKPEPKSIATKEKRRIGGPSDLAAAEIRNLQWLVSSPKFSRIVIGEDGFPAKNRIARPEGLRPAQALGERATGPRTRQTKPGSCAGPGRVPSRGEIFPRPAFRSTGIAHVS